ncbi:MAG TPA: DUF4382 domain-containing protein, partial [Candidatus Dormibacteraeota bacterium]|nr:DUF4382 domain-containing protein [Candidatus Dormibacteraeota bacterium]
MLRSALYGALTTALTAVLAGCGGGGSGSGATSVTPMTGTVPMVISDASSDDWATIGVKVLSIALVPQGGGSTVTVYSAASPAPYVNLEQLDQLGEILGNVTVPVGTYTAAVLTVGANPGDVLLTVAANPESGFPLAGGTSVDPSLIQIQGKQGSSGNLTVPVRVDFESPLSVTTGQNNALDLEFDLAHPAFIVGHNPPAAMGATLWAVNFKGPLRHHPVRDIAWLLLRHSYGTVTQVASDGSSFTMTKDFPKLPVSNPESAVASSIALQIEADATNGTIFYDVDAKTRTVVKDFTAEAMSLPNKFVRVAARYQENGSLVAVRVWASTDFSKVWLSPEGHVLHVDTTSNTITVADERGLAVPISVDANTQFFYRTPADAQADTMPIGTGPGFLANNDLVRGFKVHVSAVDPLASPMVAQSIDIETAAYSGRISAADANGFTYTRQFPLAGDDYTVTRTYINAASPNTDPSGDSVTGFLWWDLTLPTLATTGSNAVPAFIAATNGGVNFGGSVGALTAWGASGATWGDMATPGGWSLRNAVLVPTPVPLGLVTTAFAGNTFAIAVTGGAMPATVDVSTTPQS